jgi:hypothetical protein
MKNFLIKTWNLILTHKTELFINIISLILLIFISPVFSLLWVCLPTFYFFYVGNYNEIYRIWVFMLGIWYIIFSTSLAEIKILIGFNNTEVVINYLLDNKIMFESLCFQTVLLVHALSAKLGFSLYIPAFVNILGPISRIFKNDPTQCAEKKSWFSFTKTINQDEVDMSACPKLAKNLEKCFGVLHGSNSTTDGKRTVTYSRTTIPGFGGAINNCHARDANQLEKDLFNNQKDQS